MFSPLDRPWYLVVVLSKVKDKLVLGYYIHGFKMEKEMELLGTLLNNCEYTLDVLVDIFSRVQMWSKVIAIVFGQKKLLGHLGPPCQFYKVVFWGGFRNARSSSPLFGIDFSFSTQDYGWYWGIGHHHQAKGVKFISACVTHRRKWN